MKCWQRLELGQDIFNLILLLLTLTVSTSSDEVTPNWEDAQSSSVADQPKPEPATSSSALDDDGIIVDTLRGKFRGRVMSFTFGNRNEGLVGAFLGIPYAEPPVRELRFRAPMPPKPWDGVFNATAFSPICYQPGEQKIYDVVSVRNRSTIRKRKLENYAMSEDCLTLNLYVPLTANNRSIPQGAKLSVFFYIHGGSYYMGAGRLYPGHILAASQNIIVVTFNFRLGPLGFFSTGDETSTGNWGLLDQAQALDWVYQNIESFGGDPSRITLVGNSAGGASVMFHLVSPISIGKFVAVTVQSGCSAAPWAVQYAPKKHAEDLARKLGCPVVPTPDMVDCIRTFSPKLIMKHANLEDGLSLAFAAVIDGKFGGSFLPAHPEQLIRQDQFHHVPVLTGFTRDEVTIWFTLWGPSSPTKHLQDFLKHDVLSLLRNLPNVTPANLAAALHSVKVQYLTRHGISDNDTLGKTSAVSDFISDVGLKAPCVNEMNLLAQHNKQPVYLYEFQYYSVDDVKMNRQEWIGSYHESELQFIFGETYLNYSNHLRSYDDKKISDLMMKVWGNFVKYGNPTPTSFKTGLKFTWTNYTQRNQDFAVLGLKSRMEKYFHPESMMFWNYFFPILRDYPLVYEPPTLTCDDWEMVQKSWTFWTLVSFTTSLAFFFTVFLTCRFRQKKSRSVTKTRIQITTNPNNSISAGNVGSGNPNNCSPIHSSSCRGSLVIHTSCQCQAGVTTPTNPNSSYISAKSE